MHSDQALYDQLNSVAVKVEKQIQVLKDRAVEQEADVYEMIFQDGTPVLASLLIAKAQVLHGMATLKASRKK